ncbi:sulfite exporter TauE/SafE family protein [Chitinimonas lacunae]|uniref:Sulfite exporter TauE/SafE family protein n=1 Tax=Chitinimonas lacunae TaxID=1963018 RepID=A0ABV8MV17_9NEIS
MFDSSFLANLAGWWLAGLMGGVHCLGMCGGLSAAIALQLPADRPRWPLLLTTQLGRIGSYCLIGALMGGVAGVIAWLPYAVWVQHGLYLVSLLLMMALGLYLGGWAAWLTRIERLGGGLWRHLQPRLQRLLPIRGPGGALAAGALWGWLPCGLVYTAALGALAAGSAERGAATMLAFGLGTLPNLLAMGLAAERLGRWRQHGRVRQIMGGLLFVWAAWELLRWLSNQAR